MEAGAGAGAGEGEGEREESAAALHARLVALVRAASGDQEGRGVVWMEHSYARAKSGAAVRELLVRAPRAEPAHAHADALDVGGPEDCAPPSAEEDAEPADPDPEWEARVLALAPAPAHARAARAALHVLRALRLARLAGAGGDSGGARRDQARAAARAVRRALAPHWAAPAGDGVAPWLHGAILAHGGHGAAALWRELAGELRRAVPRLAARLLPAPAEPRADELARVGPPRDHKAPGPWLVWVCARREDRWARRLRALLHVRLVCGGAGEERSAPEAWCAALVGTARAALLDILAEAGSRPVVVGGAGAGAALCAALLAGAGVGAGAGGGAGAGAGDDALASVRGLALIAPPLLTAEGDATHLSRSELELPLLVVAGSAGATCPRGAACEVAAGGQLGGAAREHPGGAARRVLVVRGADDALRLPTRRRRLPQHALDAYVAEEVARWALAAAEGEPRRAAAARRAAGAGGGDAAEERHAHAALHNARGLVREVDPATELIRPRGSGGSRRAAPPAPPASPPAPEPRVEELDIMQLPIVFADDEEPAPAAAPAPAPAPPPIKRHSAAAAAAASPSVTVTSGHPRGGRALNYTRVIVAKRRGAARGGPGAPRGGPGAPRGGPGAPRAGPAAPAPRPVLLRRTVRLVRKER